jgi:hypothetical protein
MRSRLFLAPWWVNALVYGTLFAVAATTFMVLDDEFGWLTAVVTGTAAGAFMAAIIGWSSAREQAGWRRAAGLDLDDEQLLSVRRAVTKGLVPSDPRLRQAARDAATYDLAQLDGQWRIAQLLVFPLLFIRSLFDSWLWVVLAPLYLYGIYEIWSQPRKLRARIDLLSREPA